jgi:hypothetical protein
MRCSHAADTSGVRRVATQAELPQSASPSPGPSPALADGERRARLWPSTIETAHDLLRSLHSSADSTMTLQSTGT